MNLSYLSDVGFELLKWWIAALKTDTMDLRYPFDSQNSKRFEADVITVLK